MDIKASDVKALRDMTGAGMMDCKHALVEANGDIDKAADILREKGIAKSVKKGSRIAAEGLIDSYIHNGRVGCIVEVNSETDFVAKNDDFKEFVHNVCLQVTSQNPKYVSRDEVPEDEVSRERGILIEQALNESDANMPEDRRKMIAEKKVEGRLNKFYEEICLLDQKYILDPDLTIEQVRQNLVAKIGENIIIRRFVRFEVGEGLEKRQDNFAEEVAKQING